MTTDHTSTLPVTEIRHAKGLVPLNLHELWAYRELAFFFLWRDIKGRYKQTALGPLWMILQPLLNTLVFTIIFGKIAKFPSGDVPYPLFNYSALLLWGFFANCLGTTAGSLRTHKGLFSKVYFPRLLMPLVGTLSALLEFAISFLILLGLMVYFGYPPTWNILLLPLFLFLAALLGLAIGLWFAPWTAHFWDVGNVMNFGVRGWMYATPIVYAISLVPEHWMPLYRCNPMTNIIEGYRWAILGEGISPDILMVYTMIPVIVLLIGGAYYYRWAERSIVDIA